jgi:hypothetical protein
MKKVLFEQTTNILLVIFLALALIQSIPTAYLNDSGFYVEFGIFGAAFLVTFIVSIAFRFVLASKWKKDGYTITQGEFSTRDEREKMIRDKAVTLTYKVAIGVMTVSTAVIFFLMISSLNAIEMKQLVIAVLSTTVVLSMFAYLFSWFIFDRKL